MAPAPAASLALPTAPARPRDPRLAQIRGALDLGGRAFETLSTRAHELHRAISDLPFRGLQPVPGVGEGAGAVRALHDPITDGIYGVVRLTGQAVFGAAQTVLRVAERQAQLAPVAPTPVGADLVSAISGLVGDDMALRRNPLTPRMGFYRELRRLKLAPDTLAAAFPEARERLVVFAHGLCCNESTWAMYRDEQPEGPTDYGGRFAARGYTPLYLRYNSGLHISQNGRALARQLDRLVAAWPVPVREIVLVGHSMGGLVIRAAAHSGHQRQAPWTTKVTHLLCLGSPHLGAPLEQLVHRGVARMEDFALTRPLARVLRVRSAGIKDLRHGATHDSDWRGRDLDALDGGVRQAIARIPGARYHFLGCSLGLREGDLLDRTLGDGLVMLSSATAHDLADADSAALFGRHHLRLLNDPVAWAWIEMQLGR